MYSPKAEQKEYILAIRLYRVITDSVNSAAFFAVKMAARAINKRRLQQWQLLSTDQLTPVQVILLYSYM